MRNMIETVNKMNDSFSGYDLTCKEINQLHSMIENKKTYEALLTAFKYGFILGNHATLAGEIKERL